MNRIPVKPASLSGGAEYDGKAEIDFIKSKCRCLVVDSDELCAPFGSSKFFNIAVLGATLKTGELGLKEETVRSTIIKTVPERFTEKNLAALTAGMNVVSR